MSTAMSATMMLLAAVLIVALAREAADEISYHT
jgi:hypothetical protein